MSTWQLREFKIEKNYGKDHYEGTIRLRNDEWEEFKMNLTPRQTADILALLKPDIAFKTREMCDQLMEELEQQILEK